MSLVQGYHMYFYLDIESIYKFFRKRFSACSRAKALLIVSTTRACPYDGYLVTEADSKPLIESNKTLAETIAKISVHCLYHRSGCTWQGSLSECITHCSACTFGNSPVVCNRCGIQIVHRQVQEHAENCPGLQTQIQQGVATRDVSSSHATATTDQSQSANQVGATASQAPSSQAVAVTTMPGQHANLLGNPTSQTQPLVQAAVQPTAEQWYQHQQYQQYYQHHQGYDPYQQQYQQYYPYQQHAFPQYQLHAQAYVQALPQTQSQPQPQAQAQAQSQPQAQPQPQAQVPSQPISHVQAPVTLQSQNQMQVNQQQSIQPVLQPHGQILSVSHPPGHGQTTPQSQPPPLPYLYPQAQPQPQQHIMPHYHQSHPQMLHSHPQAQQPLQSYPVLHPSANAVTGHHSYPQPQPHQNMQLGAPQHPAHIHPQGGPQPLSQQSVKMQNQFPQQSPMMRPPQSHYMFPNQQQSTLLPSPLQGQSFPVSPQQTVHVHGQPPVQVNQRPVMHPVQPPLPHQSSVQQQASISSHVLPQGPAHPIPEHMHTYPQPQMNVVLSHNTQLNQSQNTVGRPFMPNDPAQPLAQSASALPVKPAHPGVSHLPGNQNMMVGTNNQLQFSAELQSKVSEPIARQGEVVTEQKVDSPLKKLGKSVRDLGTMLGSVTETRPVRPGSDIEPIEVGNKQRGEDSESVKTSGTNVDALGNGDSVNQNLVKEDAGVRNDTVSEHSIVKEAEIKNSSLQEKELLEQLSAKSQKDDIHAPQTVTSADNVSTSVSQSHENPEGSGVDEYRGITPLGPGLSHPAQFVDQGKHQQPIINNGLRPPVNLASQLPHPGVPNQPFSAGPPSAQFQNQEPSLALHPGQPLNSAENFQPPTCKQPQGSEIQHGAMPGPGSFSSHGAPGETFQPQSLGPPGSYNHGQAPPFPSVAFSLSHVESVGPGMMANLPPRAPEVQRSHQHPSNMMAAKTYPHQRPGYLNGPQGFGLQEERYKSFPVPGQHNIDQREFEDDLKKFTRPLDAELNSKVGGYSLGPRDSGSHGFNYDGGSKIIHGKSDHARYGLTPTSPLGEYAEMPSRRLGLLSGSLASKSDIDGFDGRGPRRFGGSVGAAFGDAGFHHLPSHLHRGEFERRGNFLVGECPRSGDFIREDSFAGHFRRGEHLGTHNFPRHFAHTGNMRTTELGGPHSFESFNRSNRSGHPRLGEPGFRSSFSLPGFPNDGGFLTGDIGSFDDLWKRKAASMGWCRICKVDCESVEGLDLHSQTREHQKKAMDMVKKIKQNAKKQKLTPSEQSSVEDGSKSRNIGFQGRGIKH
ncbi:hypothetical protein L6164_017065 [Bauhinia variegata]|uniref:Uncharacterized protein n=1 Tax=Bauhinia variegata TaxID=167791 RepID=A0ACB9NAC7_BAUVA|nr:hypothetical protein L6164_017065 [Bauhinia variegata]